MMEMDPLFPSYAARVFQLVAYVDVPDITLNTNDTVQYTWTVDVD